MGIVVPVRIVNALFATFHLQKRKAARGRLRYWLTRIYFGGGVVVVLLLLESVSVLFLSFLCFLWCFLALVSLFTSVFAVPVLADAELWLVSLWGIAELFLSVVLLLELVPAGLVLDCELLVDGVVAL
jgi:hypothetical protein